MHKFFKSQVSQPKLARLSIGFVLFALISLLNASFAEKQPDLRWTVSEVAIIKSLSLSALSKPSIDPSNSIAENAKAKQLGERLFFDKGLSANQKVACASCHQPELHFTDGQRLSKGIGSLNRNSPTLLGAGYQTWFYADGRRDSLWAQALTPLESMEEMGNTRSGVVKYVLSHKEYGKFYNSIFGPTPFTAKQIPNNAGPYGDKLAKKTWRYLSPNLKHQVNQVFSNIGRAIAAYERDILPKESKFDFFAKQLDERTATVTVTVEKRDTPAPILSSTEKLGLKLFIDNQKTQCLKCHNGPLLTNGDFHNIGTAKLTGENMDLGRMIGLQAVFADEFNCFGRYSGVRQTACKALQFVDTKDSHSPSLGAYKVPTLRGLAKTGPYGHDGKFNTLEDFLKHYRDPPDKSIYQHELVPLDLSDSEISQLAAFLKAL